jgi:pimeloyl-ACP methyl ester carboxylesterase
MQALAVEGPVDLCGFSFGGRVVLAVAATKPHLANRLVATGRVTSLEIPDIQGLGASKSYINLS